MIRFLLASLTSIVCAVSAFPAEWIGGGDGQIYVIPALSSSSVKNGGKLTVSAVVKAQAGVRKVVADIGGVILELYCPAASAGAPVAGLWSAEWIAQGLEDKVYPIELRVTDCNQHIYVDRSLSISDPAAGISTPGSTNYPNGGLREVGSLVLAGETPACSVIDTANGYAYFGTSSSPGRVVKVALGTGASPPQRVSALTLNNGEDSLSTAVIDAANGYAYFANNASPAMFIKVSLGSGDSPPARIGSVTFNANENLATAAGIDTQNGYAYVGTIDSPASIVKVALGAGNSPPTRVAGLILNAGENQISAGCLDPANGYGYFSTESPGPVGALIKITLGNGNAPPLRVGAVALTNPVTGAVIDPLNSYAYFVGNSIEKFDLSQALPVQVASTPLPFNYPLFGPAVIAGDIQAGYLYIESNGSNNNPAQFAKFAVGPGSASPYQVGGTQKFNTQETSFTTAVIDPTLGYLYFGSSDPAVVKFAVSGAEDPPVLAGTTSLVPDSSYLLMNIGLDSPHEYAYFASSTSLIKIDLSTTPPTRLGSTTLTAGDGSIESGVIDAVNGYAYVCTNAGNVVKLALGVGAVLPSELGAVALDSQANVLPAVVIDQNNGYLYIAASTSASVGEIVKVAVGVGDALPSEVGAIASGPGSLACAVIDPANGYLYIGTYNPSTLIKASLGSGANPPAVLGATDLNLGLNYVSAAAIDTLNGNVYVQSTAIVKVAVGNGTALPTVLGSATLSDGPSSEAFGLAFDGVHGNLFAAGAQGISKVAVGIGSAPPVETGYLLLNQTITGIVLDPAGNYGYFGAPYSSLLKIDLANNNISPLRVGAGSLYKDDGQITCGVFDQANGYAYFGMASPGKIAKVALRGAGLPPVRIADLTLDTGENNISCAAIDAANGYAYFGTGSSPGRIVKIALGAGSAAPAEVGSVILNSGENLLRSAAIDSANGFAYFGTDTSPGIVAKVALGSGASLPSEIGSVALQSGENGLRCAVLDAVNQYLYVGCNTSPGIVSKISCGGVGLPVESGSVILQTGENNLSCAAIDATQGYACFGTSTSPGIVVKVALGTGATAPSRLGAATLNSGEDSVSALVLDAVSGNAVAGAHTDPGIAIKVAVGSGTTLPSRTAAIGIDNNFPSAAVFDARTGYSYIADSHFIDSRLVQLAHSQKEVLKATQMTLAEPAAASDLRFYSHTANGNVRLAIYDNASPKNLLWDSGSIPNAVNNGLIIAPIANGTPALLPLSPGVYWLAWQVDTTSDVPSYTAGSIGDGFYLDQSFGPYPATISAGTPSSERWTEYITYSTPATITWNNPADITFGTPLGAAQLNATANTPGSFSYTLPTGTMLNAGPAQTLSVTFTPTDTANYTPVTKSVSINVLKAAPTITWTKPAAIVAGTALDAAQLNATASVPGTFTYSPAPGTVLGIGNGQALTVAFTSADAANFTNVTASVSIDVLNAVPAFVSTPTAAPNPATVATPISFAAAAADADGDTLSYAWDFGDGTLGSGAVVTHTYAAPGLYSSQVTITDSHGASAAASITVTVVAAEVEVGGVSLTDSNGDGIPDEMQASADANSIGTLQSTATFGTLKVAATLNFMRASSDSIKLSAVMTPPAGFNPAGAIVIADVGGVVRTFKLDKNGKSKLNADAFSLAIKSGKLTATFSHGSFAGALLNYGLTNATVHNTPVTIPVFILIGNRLWSAAAVDAYTAKKNKSGNAN